MILKNEQRKDCCNNPINYSFRPYTDNTAELRCKKCGYIIREFNEPKQKTIQAPSV